MQSWKQRSQSERPVIHIRQIEPRGIINTRERDIFIGPLMRAPCRAITLEETQFVPVRLSSGRSGGAGRARN